MGRTRQPYSLWFDTKNHEYVAKITTDQGRISQRLGTHHEATAHRRALECSIQLNGICLNQVKDLYLIRTQAGIEQRESVKRSLDEFIKWIGNVPAQSLTLEDLVAYDKYLQEKDSPLNPTSRHIKLAGIRAALNKAGISIEAFKKFKMPKKLVREDFLSEDQISDLRKAAAVIPLYQAYIDLLLYTGARVGEIHNLRWNMISEKQIKLTGKTGPRMFPVDAKLSVVIQSIRKHAVGKLDTEDYLLTDYRSGEQMDPRWGNLSKIVRRFMDDAKIPAHFSAHHIRHTYISYMIMDGHSIHKVMKLTGHTEVKTFERYLHLQPSFLENSAPSY